MAALTEVDDVLRSLRGVWDEDAVDELDHALQAAARAVDDKADDELVLAAALHDVGHSPLFGEIATRHHDRVARDWLTPRFGERVGWLAGYYEAFDSSLIVQFFRESVIPVAGFVIRPFVPGDIADLLT
jgi:predicted HD phosphohydrolase